MFFSSLSLKEDVRAESELNTFASSEGHLSTPTPIEILELLKIEVLLWSEHVRINSTACIFNGVIRASACV